MSGPLDTAEAEARRFLKAVAALRAVGKISGYQIGTKESGAVRRASMDLTRALAELRRPS
jgi:hypothetical protein